MKEWFSYHASVAACFARLAIQRQIEYPLFLVSWFFNIVIYYFAGVWSLRLMVEQFQPLNGWDFPELTFLFGLGLLTHGLQVVFFIQTWNIDGMVVHGGFDRMLLRPMNVFFQFAVSYVNFIGLFDLIPGIIVFAYGCQAIGFQWTLPNVLKLGSVIIGGVMIRTSIYTIMGSVAFWTKRSGSLVRMSLRLMEHTTMYPLSIFPRGVQMLLTFVLPVGFISFYPALDFVGADDAFALPIGLSLYTPAVGAALFAVAYAVFLLGLKRYESAGS